MGWFFKRKKPDPANLFIGGKYVLMDTKAYDGSPWPYRHPMAETVVQITDLKDGWVRYDMIMPSGNRLDRRLKRKTFQDIYMSYEPDKENQNDVQD